MSFRGSMYIFGRASCESRTKAAKEVHGLWEIPFAFPAVKIGQRFPGEAGMQSEEKSWTEAADLLPST